MSLARRAQDDIDWRPLAKCRLQALTSIFYPTRDTSVYSRDAPIAKAMCLGKDSKAPCPVRKECLMYAMLNDEEHGIWGGKSRRERNAMVRKAKRFGVPMDVWIETRT